MTTITGIILAHNVEDEIVPALKTLTFCHELIVVDTDTGSTDHTVDVARKFGAKIVKSPGYNFSTWRNDGAKAAKGDWLLYLDSDERIPSKLRHEILHTVDRASHTAYTIPRYEVFLGKHLDHWPDSRVIRLFRRSALKGYHGKLHEQPKFDGTLGDLKESMVHLSHKNIDEKIIGTIKWSRLEAEMLYKANHPQMKGWRFIRIMMTEFLDRFIKQGLYHDGTEGYIEAIYQMFSKFMTYERLWEMQRKPSLKETYANIDKKILDDIKNDQ